jgi:hypothetical protein
MASRKQTRAKLLPHEAKLLADGELEDVTHKGASATWLSAASSAPIPEGTTVGS